MDLIDILCIAACVLGGLLGIYSAHRESKALIKPAPPPRIKARHIIRVDDENYGDMVLTLPVPIDPNPQTTLVFHNGLLLDHTVEGATGHVPVDYDAIARAKTLSIQWKLKRGDIVQIVEYENG